MFLEENGRVREDEWKGSENNQVSGEGEGKVEGDGLEYRRKMGGKRE